jgi:hypothetical protein
MTRAIAVPLQHLQQLADRSVIWDGVGHGHYCLEPEDPLRIAMHHSSLVRLLAAFVLHVVLSVAVSLPDVDFDAFDRLAFGVFDGADYQAGLTVGVVGDLSAVRLRNRVVRVEGAENGAFGAGNWFGVVDAVD